MVRAVRFEQTVTVLHIATGRQAVLIVRLVGIVRVASVRLSGAGGAGGTGQSGTTGSAGGRGYSASNPKCRIVPVIGVRTVSPYRRILSVRLDSTVRRKNRFTPISVIRGKVPDLSVLRISILAAPDYVDDVENVDLVEVAGEAE